MTPIRGAVTGEVGSPPTAKGEAQLSDQETVELLGCAPLEESAAILDGERVGHDRGDPEVPEVLAERSSCASPGALPGRFNSERSWRCVLILLSEAGVEHKDVSRAQDHSSRFTASSRSSTKRGEEPAGSSPCRPWRTTADVEQHTTSDDPRSAHAMIELRSPAATSRAVAPL